MSDLPQAGPAGPLPPRATDYAHARHAGNVGDVFKHVAVAAALRHLRPALYAESHAGDGLFSLGSVGEWTTGVARLWAEAAGLPGAVDAWQRAVRAFSPQGAARPERYPGSPLLARALLPDACRLVLHELDPNAAAVLRRALAADGRPQPAEVREADGFAGLVEALRGAGSAPALALVDPPYTGKEEWARAAATLAEAREAAPGACLLLWYPLKALTRPRALLADLARRGVHGTAVELVSTPLRLKRDRLAGSGVVLVHAPEGAAEDLCAALPRLGPPLATHGEWSANLIGF